MGATKDCKKYQYEFGELLVEKATNEGKPSIKMKAGSATLFFDYLIERHRDQTFAAFNQWSADIYYRALKNFTIESN